MPVMTTCPNCQQSLRVTDTQVGRAVRCPACRTVFSAGIDRSGIQAVPQAGAAAHQAIARARTSAPGCGLVVNGLLTLVLFGAALAYVALAAAGRLPEVPKAVTAWNERQEAQNWPVITRIEVEDGFTRPVIIQLVILGVGAAIGLSVMIAGFQMRRLRGYRNSVLAAVVSVLPITTCLWGLPFGVWALIVLSDPTVKRAFES